MKPRKKARSARRTSKRSDAPDGYCEEGEQLIPHTEEAAIVRQVYADFIASNGDIMASIENFVRSIRARERQIGREQARLLKGEN